MRLRYRQEILHGTAVRGDGSWRGQKQTPLQALSARSDPGRDPSGIAL